MLRVLPPFSLFSMVLLPAIVFSFVHPASAATPRSRQGKFTIKVVDADSGKPIAARMHLDRLLPGGKQRPIRPPRVPYWKDHFALDGEIALSLARGTYVFQLERGKEYRPQSGHFVIDVDSDDQTVVTMRRYVDMTQHGWYSGDLHVHRPVEDIELLMRADDLHVAPVITWWKGRSRWHVPKTAGKGLVRFDGNRFYEDRAGEDERNGGALLYFGLAKPLDLEAAESEYPSASFFLDQAREHEDVHVDVEKPFWWDVPVWLASGKVDTIGIAHNHMWREGVLDNEAWGRPRDRTRYPGPHGNGRWTQTIYYHALNCGLRIPPTAGSASGVLPNPVGYNRVYVHCGSDFTYPAWWKNLRAGRVFVTNGPLMRVEVEGRLPGHVFQGKQGETLEFEIGMTLTTLTNERIEYLEVIKDGRPLYTVRLDEFKERKGQLPKVNFTESGWFQVRAVTNKENTYRFAATGPYYVEFDYQPRISRASAEFFVDWINQRIKNLDLDDPQQEAAVLEYQHTARDYWQALADKATGE